MRNERWLTMVMAGLMSLAINAKMPTDSVAGDFTCETVDGRQLTLKSMPSDRLTLLVFYDPDCGDCRQELFALRHSSLLRQAVGEGRIQVLAVYAEADEQLWRQTATELPATWTVAIARTDIKGEGFYDLSSMPAIFLLDNDKKMMQKELDYSRVAEVIRRKFKNKNS